MSVNEILSYDYDLRELEDEIYLFHVANYSK